VKRTNCKFLLYFIFPLNCKAPMPKHAHIRDWFVLKYLSWMFPPSEKFHIKWSIDYIDYILIFVEVKYECWVP
jgi:hypothetical protein